MNYRDVKYKNTKIKSINIITGETKIYNDLNEIEKEGFSKSNVLKCIRGVTKTHKKLSWRLLENDK